MDVSGILLSYDFIQNFFSGLSRGRIVLQHELRKIWEDMSMKRAF